VVRECTCSGNCSMYIQAVCYAPSGMVSKPPRLREPTSKSKKARQEGDTHLDVADHPRVDYEWVRVRNLGRPHS